MKYIYSYLYPERFVQYNSLISECFSSLKTKHVFFSFCRYVLRFIERFFCFLVFLAFLMTRIKKMSIKVFKDISKTCNIFINLKKKLIFFYKLIYIYVYIYTHTHTQLINIYCSSLRVSCICQI